MSKCLCNCVLGSLLRPEELVRLRYAVAEKKATAESLVPVEQRAIQDIVALQKECGIHAVTNGEYSRHQFWGTFFETLNGMEEINLREGGYDQSIFRLYAPGKDDLCAHLLYGDDLKADIADCVKTFLRSCMRSRFLIR